MDRELINEMLGMDESELDSLADFYEQDMWDSSSMGEVLEGQPSLSDDETTPIVVELPLSKLVEVDRRAASRGETRSSAVLAAIDDWLKGAAAL